MMTKSGVILVIFLIMLYVQNVNAVEEKLIASDGDARFRFGVSTAIDSLHIFVGAPGSLSDGDNRGAVYFYLFDENEQQWREHQKITIDDETYDLFGASIAQSDSFLIVGAHGDSLRNPFGGAAFLYKQNNDLSWTFSQKLVTRQFLPMDKFGYAVDIDGNWAVVGAPRTGGRLPLSGAVYVYQLVNNEWILDATLVGTPSAMYDNFGCAVALSEDELIVGAAGFDVDSTVPQKQHSVGSAFIFTRGASGWTQTAYLSPADGNIGNSFGCAVAIDGDYAVVGAGKDDVLDFDDGSAYMYKKNDTSWYLDLKLTALDADSGDFFGAALDLSGEYLVIGAPGANSAGQNSGAVYSFLRTDEGWTQRAKKMAYDAEKYDVFGASVAVSRTLSVIGAPHKKIAGRLSQGAAYVYDNIADLALPVELTSFTATYSEGDVRLQWITQSEKDNLGFILQRSENEKEWQIIASFQTHDELRGQGSTSMPSTYEFLDDSIESNHDYFYRLADVDYNGVITYHNPIKISCTSQVVAQQGGLPENFHVYPAFPNPFNPQTTIRYDLAKKSNVTISIVDIAGKHVRTLVDQVQEMGSHSAMWNACNENGLKMSSGVYLIQIRADEVTSTQKVILLQ